MRENLKEIIEVNYFWIELNEAEVKFPETYIYLKMNTDI